MSNVIPFPAPQQTYCLVFVVPGQSSMKINQSAHNDIDIQISNGFGRAVVYAPSKSAAIEKLKNVVKNCYFVKQSSFDG